MKVGLTAGTTASRYRQG
jgi:hypothetical protein